MKLFFDLETIPGTAAYLAQEAEDATKPSAAIKKPETLARWMSEERPAAVAENFAKFALAPETGEIISIAAVSDTDEEFAVCRRTDEDERDLLISFYCWADGLLQARRQPWKDAGGADWLTDPEPVHLVAHNAQFDLGFLRNRTAVCQLTPSFRLPSALDRPGKEFTCTMQLWGGFGARVSLRRVALALDLPDPKSDMDGGDVFDAWKAGRYAEIAKYNLRDARTCKAIFEALAGVGVAA